MIKLSKSTNRKIFLSMVVIGVFIFSMFFFRYKEVVSYEYRGNHVKIALDRVRMRSIFCKTCDATWGITENELYYVVFLMDNIILRIKGAGSSEGCSVISENCSYIDNDTLNILYYRPGAALKLKLPLDGKKYSIRDIKILGYEHQGSLSCEDLKNGYGHSLKGIISQGQIDKFLEWGLVDY